MTSSPESSADHHARLQARVAELEQALRIATAGEAVRYGMDGRPVPMTSSRAVRRLVTLLLIALGFGLGFGFGNRYARAGQSFQDGMRNPSPGAEVPLPSYQR